MTGPITVNNRLKIKNPLQDANATEVLVRNSETKEVSSLPKESFFADINNEIQSIKNPDIVLKSVTPTIEGLNISAPADSFEWRITQVVFDNTPALSATLTPASDGFYRKDALLGTNTNSYLIVEGIEGDESVAPPTVFPEGTILLGVIDVFGNTVGGFSINDTSRTYVYGNGGATDYVEVTKPGTTLEIRNATSLTGFTIPAKNIQYGKDYYLRNSTGGVLTLKSATGTNGIRFYFPQGDLVIPVNNNVHLKYLSNGEFGGLGYFTLVGIDYKNKADKTYVDDTLDTKVDKVAGKSLISDVEITRLSTLVNYIHPENHPPSIITQDADNRFVSDAEKQTWNNIDLQSVIETGNIATVDYDKFFGIRTDGVSSTFISPFGVSISGGTATTYINKKTISRDGVNISLFSERDPGNYTLATVEDINNLQPEIDDKISITEKGAINGVATLGSDGKIPNSQITALAISETFPVSSQAQMLGLSQADQGDVAIRSDISKSFILRQSPASILGNWSELLSPTDAVTSVAGKVGVVTLNTSDVGGLQSALDLKANDSDVVKLTGDQNISGLKTFTNSSNSSGIYSYNTSTGDGIYSENIAGGVGLHLNNFSGGNNIVSNNSATGTGYNYVGENNGLTTYTVDKFGTTTANSFIKTGGTAAQFLKADGSVDESDVVRNIAKNATQGPNITGTVSETILYSKLIPANTFKDGDFMNLFSRIARPSPNASSGGLNQIVRINTSNTLTGATQIAINGFTAGVNGNQIGNLSRIITLYNGFMNIAPSSTSLANDYGNFNDNFVKITFDPTVDNYIFITGKLSNSADTMYHLGTKITN